MPDKVWEVWEVWEAIYPDLGPQEYAGQGTGSMGSDLPGPRLVKRRDRVNGAAFKLSGAGLLGGFWEVPGKIVSQHAI